MNWLRNPWGRPRFLPLVTGLYIFWSIIPVAVAVLFAFNDGRSRTTWQGFSTRWFLAIPAACANDPALLSALEHTLLPGGDVRGRGRAARRRPRARPPALARLGRGAGQHAHAAAARHAGAGHGRRAPAPLPPDLQRLGPGHDGTGDRPGDIRGLLRRRDRPRPAGDDRARVEEAAADLGAPPRSRGSARVVLPLLAPAIMASAGVVFALSIDDFVVTQYLPPARTRTPSRCCSTRRRAARRRRRSTRSPRSRSSSRSRRSRWRTLCTDASPGRDPHPRPPR